METIIKKMKIDLISQDSVSVPIPGLININELYYEIQYNPKFDGVTLFLDVVDGKEKALMLLLNNKGLNQSSLNPENIYKEENFKVEKIIFQCFRKVELTFTLKRQEQLK